MDQRSFIKWTKSLLAMCAQYALSRLLDALPCHSFYYVTVTINHLQLQIRNKHLTLRMLS
jgi:hypothetical protein